MRALLVVGAVVVVTGCGGGGGGGGGGGTPPPPAVASVAITPGAAQSTQLCGTINFTAQPKDASGGNLSRTVTWTTSAAGNVSLSSTSGTANTATGVGVGSSTIMAAADGISSPGITVTVGAAGSPATSGAVDATTSNTFSPACIVVAAGSAVTWTFATTHNVTFGTNKPAGGDIGNHDSGTDARTFATAGNYSYTCTLHPGMNGRVIVQ